MIEGHFGLLSAKVCYDNRLGPFRSIGYRIIICIITYYNGQNGDINLCCDRISLENLPLSFAACVRAAHIARTHSKVTTSKDLSFFFVSSHHLP